MALGRSGRFLERHLGGLGRLCWGLLVRSWVSCWRPRWQRNPENMEQNVAPRGRRLHCGFLMDFASMMSTGEIPTFVFEPRNPSVKCISAFSAQTQHFARVGCQHGPMLTSKISENRGPGGVRASLGRCWKAPGGSAALPGRSGEFAGGFGEVLGRF